MKKPTLVSRGPPGNDRTATRNGGKERNRKHGTERTQDTPTKARKPTEEQPRPPTGKQGKHTRKNHQKQEKNQQKQRQRRKSPGTRRAAPKTQNQAGHPVGGPPFPLGPATSAGRMPSPGLRSSAGTHGDAFSLSRCGSIPWPCGARRLFAALRILCLEGRKGFSGAWRGRPKRRGNATTLESAAALVCPCAGRTPRRIPARCPSMRTPCTLD